MTALIDIDTLRKHSATEQSELTFLGFKFKRIYMQTRDWKQVVVGSGLVSKRQK